MSLLGTQPPSQEFVEAVLLTTESERQNGEPWCLPSHGEILKRIVAERSRRLNGLIRQSIRLVRAMDRACERGYVEFLYVHIPTLRAKHFQYHLERALSRGRLNGVARRTERGLRFQEPEMASAQSEFELDFAQMPLIGGFIDILHNMLGYLEIQRLFSPILGPRCQASAEEAAQSLTKALVAWLKPRTTSEHHLRQANSIRKFLFDTSRANIDAIDDQAILEFWEFQTSSDDAIDGFRLYRSAARHMLAYRDALAVAITEQRLESAVGLTSSPEEVGAINIDATEISTLEVIEWQSPLLKLFSPPADSVKWLTQVDREFLMDLLPDYDVEDDEASRAKALFSCSPPNPTFYRTLARYSYFGKLQTSIVDRVKRGAPLGELPNADGYANLRERYLELAATLDTLKLALAWALLLRKSPAAISILSEIDAEALRAFARTTPDDLDESVVLMSLKVDGLARRIAEQFSASDSALGLRLRAAFRKVNRAGFRTTDGEDEQIGEGLAAGADPLIMLAKELDKITEWFARDTLIPEFMNDFAIFQSSFNRMYGMA